jgi:hypothetical protein
MLMGQSIHIALQRLIVKVILDDVLDWLCVSLGLSTILSECNTAKALAWSYHHMKQLHEVREEDPPFNNPDLTYRINYTSKRIRDSAEDFFVGLPLTSMN